MPRLHSITLFIFMLFQSFSAYGRVISVSTQLHQPYKKPVSEHLSYLIDSTHSMTVIQAKEHLLDFTHWHKPQVHFGNIQYPVWFSAQILNNSAEHIILRLNYPILDTVEFFLVDRGEVVKSFVTGSAFPFREREIFGNYFKISIPPGQYLVLIRIRSFYNVQFSATLYNWNALNYVNNREGIFQGIYIGFVVLVVIYSLFLFRKIRDEIFIYYIFHTLATAINTLHLYGYTFRFLWPNAPVINSYEPMIFGLGIFTTLFSIKFLKAEDFSPFWSKVLWGVFWVNVPVFILPFLGLKDMANTLVQLVGAIGCLLMLLAGIFLLSKGYRPARYYVVAFTFLLLGVILSILARMNVIPNHPLFIHASQYGSLLDITFLALAITDRLYIGLKERNQLRAQLIKETTEKENLIKHQYLLLREEVEKQTKQLKNVNAELEKITDELRQKNQFLTKFLSVIGHDLKNSISNLVGLIEVYSEDVRKTHSKFYNMLYKSAQNTYQILENLLLFSRINISDLRPKIQHVNPLEVFKKVEEQIKSKIQNKDIELILDCDPVGKIAADEFYLEVIVRNILDNAVKFTPKNGKITIKTYAKENDLSVIEIKDSGKGMSKEELVKFFNPKVSFTTRGTDGESGTGIGRILIKELTEAMNGSLKIESTPGAGTSFILIFDSYRK
ncbi:hypothetical protein AT05_10955 [Schleiferia thermophila str. Yellowstone]|nr:hypothetical protein AT05_10955 [Schleiferia thermophila str. Yellowstone]